MLLCPELSKGPHNVISKVFILECIDRGGVGQMMTKADEGGRGVRQLLTLADEGGRGGSENH